MSAAAHAMTTSTPSRMRDLTPGSRRRSMHPPREKGKPDRRGDPGKAVHVRVAPDDGGNGGDGATVALADRGERARVAAAVRIREELDRAAETALQPALAFLDLRHDVDGV